MQEQQVLGNHRCPPGTPCGAAQALADRLPSPVPLCSLCSGITRSLSPDTYVDIMWTALSPGGPHPEWSGLWSSLPHPAPSRATGMPSPSLGRISPRQNDCPEWHRATGNGCPTSLRENTSLSSNFPGVLWNQPPPPHHICLAIPHTCPHAPGHTSLPSVLPREQSSSECDQSSEWSSLQESQALPPAQPP